MTASPNNATGRHDMGDFIPGTAQQQVERLTFTPKEAMMTDVWFTVLERDTAEVLTRGHTTLVTSNRSSMAGKNPTLLVIGDSLTASGEHTQVLLDIAANDTMGLTLVGSRGQSATNRHEGRGGWTVWDYATPGRPGLLFAVSGMTVPPGGPDPAASAPEERYTIEGMPAAYEWIVWDVNVTRDARTGLFAGTVTAACDPCPPASLPVPTAGALLHGTGLTNSTGDARIAFATSWNITLNPFWSQSSNSLDVARYLSLHGFPTPTAATIMLGDNDLSATPTDAATDAAIVPMVQNLRALVDSLIAAGVQSVGLVWQPLPGSQDGFGANYGIMGNTGPPLYQQTGVSTSYRMKRSMLRWWAAQQSLVQDMENTPFPAWSHSSSSVWHRDSGFRGDRKVVTNPMEAGPNTPGVSIVPVGLNVDGVHSMSHAVVPANARSDPSDPTQMVTRCTNAVHPGAPGQAQIADGIWAWLKLHVGAAA